MATRTREEIDAIIASLWDYNDGYVAQHLRKLRRHLEKFVQSKQQDAREQHWLEVEHQALLIENWIAILRQRAASESLFFENFDFALLDSPGFKEDSVR